MVRAALLVADLERSRTFYTDLLGLPEVFFEGELSQGNTHVLLGVPASTRVRAVILKAPGPAYGMVGLFELAEPIPPSVTRQSSAAHVGDVTLVFYCDDLDPVHERLRRGGHTIVSPPVNLVIGDFVKQREMIFRDPDGVLINLIEWDPDQMQRPELRRQEDER
jgi:catechol 2,3-dioxygenase-like lactoylglutathione lyase family enzyme